jgi:uncharacterized membrane protein YphA (DoxX/SURF4 family)
MPDQFNAFYPWAHLLGRLLFAFVFVSAGLTRLTQRSAMVASAKSKGVPAAGFVTPASGVVIMIAGLLILLGWHRFIAAGVLFLCLVPTAFVMHPFWKVADPAARASEQSHFLKDLALAGAALLIAYYSGQAWPAAIGDMISW